MSGALIHVTSEYPPVQFGGLGTAVAGLTRALDEAGEDVVVLLVQGGGYAYGYGAGDPVPAGRPRPAPELVEATFPQAISLGPRLATARRARAVHLHSSWLWAVAEAIRDATGVPIVYTVHSLDRAEVEHGEWLPHGSVQDVVLSRADRVIVLSHGERERLRRDYPAAAARARIVGNGVHLRPTARAKRHRENGAAVLYVGRFGTRKGVRDVIEAVPAVVRHAAGARFTFVGGCSPDDGPREAAAWVPPRLRAHRRSMTFAGWQRASRIQRWYRAADVLVIPSRYEPFGMVVLEGMLHGQAIVAADAGGPAELLRHERTALLYPAGDVDALAATLVRALGDVALRRRLGSAARAEVRAHWTWPHVLPDLLAVYEELASPSSGS